MGYFEDKKKRANAAQAHTRRADKLYSKPIQNAIDNTIIYSEDSLFAKTNPKEQMAAELIAIDSVTAILNHSQNKTAVLNFASYKNPGGGFLSGSMAQEESLCHSSYLYNVISTFENEYYIWNRQHPNNNMYTNRALYTPDILFYKDDKRKPCDVITCAAPNYSHPNGISKEENLCTLDSRIKFILDVAADNRVDTLILGAFGCGVFAQDATDVATIFKKYLSNEYKVFDKIIFAIPPGPNMDKFADVFMEK